MTVKYYQLIYISLSDFAHQLDGGGMAVVIQFLLDLMSKDEDVIAYAYLTGTDELLFVSNNLGTDLDFLDIADKLIPLLPDLAIRNDGSEILPVILRHYALSDEQVARFTEMPRSNNDNPST